MGKDKVPKPTAASQVDSKPDKSAGKPEGGRGHRQRGAGTVITAKAPVVTQDGIVLKAHERLPSQLLNEYCQREKRPMPRFSAHPPGHRYKVHLADSKNARYDLEFAMVQEAESDKLARDYAALLALFHFQKSIPLESKLPEPFTTTWLQMLSSEKASKSKVTTSEPPKPALSDATQSFKTTSISSSSSFTEENKTTPSAKEKGFVFVAALDRDTADWLCDACAVQNFAKLASGAPRLRCFKCQAPRNETSTLVAPTKQLSTVKAEAPQLVVKTKTPTALLNLQSEKKFASQAEKDRALAERTAEQNRKNSYFAALRRANRPTPVLLSPSMRALLQSTLAVTIPSGSSASRALDSGGHQRLDNLLAAIKQSGLPLDGVNLEAQTGITVAAQFDSVESAVRALFHQRFDADVIAEALQSLSGKADSLLDDLSADKSLSALSKYVLDACLEFICLNVDDDRLPAALDASGHSGKKQLDVLTRSKAVDAEARITEDKHLTDELCLCGWTKSAISEACRGVRFLITKYLDSEALPSTSGLSGPEATACVCALLLAASGHSYHVDQLQLYMQSAASSVMSAEPFTNGSLNEDIERELSTLEAIYGTQYSYIPPQAAGGVCCVSITLERSGIVIDSFLKLSDPTDASKLFYPTFPSLSIVKAIPGGIVASKVAYLYGLQALAAEYTLKHVGEEVVYSLVVHIEEVLNQGYLEKQAVAGVSSSKQPDSMPSIVSALVQAIQDTAPYVSEENPKPSSVENPAPIMPPFAKPDEKVSKAVPLSEYRHSFWNKASNKVSRAVAAVPEAMLTIRKSLPAWASRQSFLDCIASTQAVVVTGETGCGKTTQIPQFLYEQNPWAKILVCQPRRLAAVGVAGRVADERGSKPGELVGYMVKGAVKVSADTSIVFCTYGVLLRRLQEDPTLKAVDYVILDEVHERNLDSDFALALLLMAAEKRPSLRLILMSATISTEKLSEYLRPLCKGERAPVLSIPGRTFPVAEYFRGSYEAAVRERSIAILRDNYQSKKIDFDESDDEGWDERSEDYQIGGKRKTGDIDFDLLVRLIMCLVAPLSHTSSIDDVLRLAKGTVLVFLPGVPEIARAQRLLETFLPSRCQCELLILHGGLNAAEQGRVFTPCRGVRVVLATNVAEASVTIADVQVVVDSCRVKELTYDASRRISTLTLKLAAKDSLRQRQGRAGRVQEGRCFRLLGEAAVSRLPAHSIPDILRTPLDRLVLQIKATLFSDEDSESTGYEDVMQVLQRCLDPPEESSVQHAVQELSQLQAISVSGALTALGKHMAAMAADPKIARLLVYGALLGCTRPIAAVAATIVSKDPFLSGTESKTASDAARQRIVTSQANLRDAHSDMLMIAEAVAMFQASKDKRRFCREYCLSYERVVEICDLQKDYLEELVALGFLGCVADGMDPRHPANRHAASVKVVNAAVCAGLYPQVAKILRPAKRFMETLGGNIERDVDAKEIKFYISSSSTTPPVDCEDIDVSALTRVFIHPTSICFQHTAYPCNYAIFSETSSSASAGSQDSKVFLRGVSEVSPVALLLFGGKLDVQFMSGTVTVDDWIRFSAPGKVVALLRLLRQATDQLLQLKVSEPGLDLSRSPLLAVVAQLIETEGLLE